MDEIEHIDRIIKEFWKIELPKQYNNHHLLKEDSLKCLIYYYLRCKLKDGWLIRHRIRIYPEYMFLDGKRADIAIVRINYKDKIVKSEYLKDCVEEVIAIIELKYKTGMVDNDFYSDVSKLKEYSKILPECQLYAGFINEEYYNEKNCSWFDGRQTQNWAKGRVSELLGYWDEDNNFKTEVKPYNNLNTDISK